MRYPTLSPSRSRSSSSRLSPVRNRSCLPYARAGLTERQAPRRPPDRFTFGPRPGDIDRVASMGLGAWLRRQLASDLPDAEVQKRLAGDPAFAMSSQEIVARYPNPELIRAQAYRREDGPRQEVPGGA